MTPSEVTAVIKARLSRHADFTHLSVHTQAAAGGRYNVCTVIVGKNGRDRLRVVNIVADPDIPHRNINNTASGAVIITLPKEYVIR